MRPSQDRNIRIGFIGAGDIVKRRHLPGLRTLPCVRIVAVANSMLASAEAFCREHAPEARPLADWQAVVADPEVDVVWIGAPPYIHCEAACRALANGKHVFTQARMAGTLAEAERMLETSRRFPHLVAAICPAPGGMRHELMMMRLLRENAIGRPHEALLHSLNPAWLDPRAPAHWRQKLEVSGHNILSLGIYIEVLQHWLGDIVEVEARGKVVISERAGYRVRIPDFIHVLAKFANGVEAVLLFSGVAARAPTDRLWIFGTDGALAYDFQRDEILLGQAEDKLEQVPVPHELQRNWAVERDFIGAVINPAAPRPRPDFAEGVRYMRVVEAVWMALQRRRVIPCG